MLRQAILRFQAPLGRALVARGAKVAVNQVRLGAVIDIDGRNQIVTKKNHTKPGKGGAYFQIETKDLRTGAKGSHRLKSGENVEVCSGGGRWCGVLLVANVDDATDLTVVVVHVRRRCSSRTHGLTHSSTGRRA